MEVIEDNQMRGQGEEVADEDVVDVCRGRSEEVEYHLIYQTIQFKRIFKSSGQSLTPHYNQFRQQMKKDIQPLDQNNSNLQSFQSLTPQQQDQYLRKEINKRIRQNQLNKIRSMSISDVNQIVDKDVEPPMDQSRVNRIRLLNMKMGVTEDTLEHSVKTPGEKYLQMMEKSQMLRKRKLAEYRKDPVMAQIKRGKLGADNFFIFFGIFGSLMIPLYIYNKFRKHRQEIVASRIAPPEVIRRLDEDSPISLQDINIHQIKYYNPERVREEQAKKKKRDERQKLERELYF